MEFWSTILGLTRRAVVIIPASLVALTLVAASCSDDTSTSGATEPTDAGLTGSINISGASTVEPAWTCPAHLRRRSW